MPIKQNAALIAGSLAVLLTACERGSESRITAAATSERQLSRIEELQASYENPRDGRVFVVAHRGCWSAAPENSVQAVQNCIDMGVEVVEIDVQLTKDRELVVNHDADLLNQAGVDGRIAEMTLAELKEVRLFERDGSPDEINGKRLVTNYRVPSLREIFEVAKGQIMINLEIKSSGFGFEETFDASVSLAREMGVENHILWKIPASNREYSAEIAGNFKGSLSAATPANTITTLLDTEGLNYVTPIIRDGDRDFTDQIGDFKSDNIIGFEIVTPDLGYWPLDESGRVVGWEKYRYMAIAVLPHWSGHLSDDVGMYDPDASWGRLIDMGVDLVMTDRPEQLIAYLEERGLR